MSNEPQANTGDLQTHTSTNVAQAAVPRMRRFQRAMPNLAVSSGLERIRRLSGHYSSNMTGLESNELASSSHHSHNHHHIIHHPTPLSPLVTQSTQLIESVLSPKVNTHSPAKSVDFQTTTSISLTPTKETFKSSLLNKHEENTRKLVTAHTNTTVSSIISIPPSPMEPQTPTLFQNTPCGSVYNPKFSSEQIMNTIKLRAMIKLKKIESENLREKRKKYKKELNEMNKLIELNKEEDSLTSSLDSNASNASNILRVDRSKMKMRDLLYYNPKSNKKVEKPQTQLTPSKKARQIEQTDENQIQTATLNIAPQLKIAEDGSVVINEESLFIREKEAVYEETIIENENNDGLTYNSYRKFHHTKKWSRKETAKFYKALSMVGTDFTMIQRLFSYRNRDEIKRKFKREEKINQALIDKILSKTSQVDLSVFVSSASENEDNRDNSSENTSAKRAKKKLQKKQQSENGSTASGTENLKPDQSITQNEKRKKEKLKRVKKREFVGSESEDEQNQSNKELLSSKTANAQNNNKNLTTLVTSTTNIPTPMNKLFASFEKDKPASSQLVLQQSLTVLPPCSTLIYSSVTSTSSSSPTSSVISSSFASSNSDKSKLVLNDQINYNQKEEEEGESIELIFDLDNNMVEEVIQSPNVHSESHTQQQMQLQLNKADSSQVLMNVDMSQTSIPTSSSQIENDQSELNDDDEEHVIFDLDNNQVIKNAEVIDMNSIEYSVVDKNGSNKSDTIIRHQQQQSENKDDQPKTSSSCITITRVTLNNNSNSNPAPK